MDIVVKGRKTEVTERFRKHVLEKLSRVERFDGKAISLDVELSKERNPRQSERCDRIEITLRTRGPVVRAEACAGDPYAALDLATGKLEARLRRAADRRRVHHGRRSPVSVSVATSTLAELEAAELAASQRPAPEPESEGRDVRHVGPIEVEGDGPMIVREKNHTAPPMDLSQALYEMELVGHDFYLFVDAETKQPSVVYRRRGYDYGVIHLEESGAAHYSGEDRSDSASAA
ncbi:ribosome-associated translation inhibitor RaiA [Actinocrinis puniceicyclus]|uniref:Ribosome hibernation promoting factor n=1 Tax=Actinocrinis puniceicyclus TaxID=977794 RepID=A0A8J8BBK3_9ACTN|nr:ribosome-associated translation inhibitor RaiA [Actinocrinis puniceicyclus]MBS2962166.1 ribosome-associated translation inhibitor RaiA [Actinocrinis puniceicyclus]